MDPEDISCPKCGSILPCDHSFSSNECNEDSTSCLDEVVKERKSDKSDDESTNIERDCTSYDIEEFQNYSLNETDSEWDPSCLHCLKKDPLISAGNPPISPSISENFIEERQEDRLEVTCASGDRHENVPEFLSCLQTDTLYSDESITVFSQDRNPLDGLEFEHLVTDDFSVTDQRKDEIDKTIDSCEKQSESSLDDLAKAIRDLRIETFSDDYCGASDPNSLPEKSEFESAFECPSFALPSCSHAGPSKSGSSEHSKSKKSPLKQSPEKKFKCSTCGERLSTKESFQSHQLLHAEQKSNSDVKTVDEHSL